MSPVIFPALRDVCLPLWQLLSGALRAKVWDFCTVPVCGAEEE